MKTNGVGNPYGPGLPCAGSGIQDDKGFKEILEGKMSGTQGVTTGSPHKPDSPSPGVWRQSP